MSTLEARDADRTREIADHRRRDDVGGLIGIIRESARANRRVFAEPAVKAWCARRWRHLFLREAVEDQVALEAASTGNDRRPPRQRIAERYLAEDVAASWQDEQPDPIETTIPGTALLVCPGLLNGMLPEREFRDDLPRIEWRYRMRVLRAASHPARGCEANVADIMRALDAGKGSDARARPIADEEAREMGAPGNVMVIAYSKGAPDMLTTLVKHPELKERVRCIFTWAGAIGGSEVADDLAAKFKATRFERQAADLSFKLKGFAHTFMNDASEAQNRVDEFDTVSAVRDLTTQRQAGISARARGNARRSGHSDVHDPRCNGPERSAGQPTRRLQAALGGRSAARHAGCGLLLETAAGDGNRAGSAAWPPLGPRLSRLPQAPVAEQHLSPLPENSGDCGHGATCHRAWSCRLTFSAPGMRQELQLPPGTMADAYLKRQRQPTGETRKALGIA